MKVFDRLIEWYAENYVFYGDPWKEWWEKEGNKSFFKFARERKLEYAPKPDTDKKCPADCDDPNCEYCRPNLPSSDFFCNKCGMPKTQCICKPSSGGGMEEVIKKVYNDAPIDEYGLNNEEQFFKDLASALKSYIKGKVEGLKMIETSIDKRMHPQIIYKNGYLQGKLDVLSALGIEEYK